MLGFEYEALESLRSEEEEERKPTERPLPGNFVTLGTSERQEGKCVNP